MDGNARKLVEEIARAIVDSPDAVSVVEVDSEDESQPGAVLQLRVAPDEVGKVIGKQGRTARSIRTILAAAGMKLHKRFELEILE
jgi:hypothetical protein